MNMIGSRYLERIQQLFLLIPGRINFHPLFPPFSLLALLIFLVAVVSMYISSAYPLSGRELVEHMHDVPYQILSGSEQAFNEFKIRSNKSVLTMKLAGAWSADTEANRSVCLKAERIRSSLTEMCKELNQKTVIAMMPDGRQPLFVVYFLAKHKISKPIVAIVEVKSGKFQMQGINYYL